MATRYLLGNEAIAHACLEGNADFACGYPGTPSSEVIDILRAQQERQLYVEWSTNEKVAFENALGASWSGIRALCTMKHVGMNVASDPLMTSAYTGVTGGFVILCADDPFAHSSQNEQDSRWYAHASQVPCLDPSSVQEAHDMIRDAFSLSEEFGLPVIVRPTTRICHSKSDVELGPIGTEHRIGEFRRDPKQYVMVPAHARVLHTKLNEKQEGIKKRLVELGYNRYEIRGETAIIANGVAAAYVQEVMPEGVSFMTIGAYPIDGEWLAGFVGRHRKVLVVEELDPVVEEAVRQVATATEVHGKMNGYLPREGEFTPAVVAAALQASGFTPTRIFPESPPVPGIPPRPPILCAGCMHRATFYAMRKVFRDAVFPSDIGCYTLGLQLGAVDTTICMGASITVGSGIAQSGEQRDVVCSIGDSTFLHSGIHGLINAVYNGADMIVVILDNRTTAMTGHQPNPTTGVTATGEPSGPISLDAICRACGVSFVETVDPYDLPLLIETFRQARERNGVRVIISKQPCVITARRAGIRRKPYAVDPDRCTGCGICRAFGCPAIVFTDDHAAITDLCAGCGVCADICPAGAIAREGRR
ncbi:MAG: indolepyruvate ferredoxin oxidoreductase subunit alpha [Methanomicrobiaceae archaeon]|uniref:Indolepyruvate oxidoreductase subunit iora n=1 Tax=hydrocarbon metagenome TaxID=938273 RepID=A0A0W8FJ61_9ZZZZ|nr:indolepyruvate ferredoxin oxidoreductase subunit alpha [Methanomicrobiaceae archaeon]MDD5418963.1 indolepyruvate ferredoxin oxidoreductase subunit alpha [Methanomicrobiaceae archaeon]